MYIKQLEYRKTKTTIVFTIENSKIKKQAYTPMKNLTKKISWNVFRKNFKSLNRHLRKPERYSLLFKQKDNRKRKRTD